MLNVSEVMLNVTAVSPPPPPYSALGDTFCGVVCVIILVVGVCANIPAVYIFAVDITRKVYINEKKLCFDSLFLCIAITDTLVCMCMFPVMLSFMDGRNELFFANSTFCQIWGVTWTILPFFSVFLVATLSFTRTYTLIRPLGIVRVKYIFGTILTYLLFLISRSLFPLFFAQNTTVTYQYYPDSVLCMEDITPINAYWHFKMIANQVQLLLPVFPVTISCITSLVVLNMKKSTSVKSNRVAKMQSEATMTILMVTLIYWLCNVPVVANYLYYHIGTISAKKGYMDLYGSSFMYNYSWLSTLTLSVGLNALLDPVVYFARMKRFKDLLRLKVNKARDRISVTLRPSLSDLGRRTSSLRLSRMSTFLYRPTNSSYVTVKEEDENTEQKL